MPSCGPTVSTAFLMTMLHSPPRQPQRRSVSQGIGTFVFFGIDFFFPVQDARAFLEQHANISAACKTEEFERCLRPALADKVITGEMEWLKRGRFERLFPVEDSAEAHLPLLRGSANAAAVYWHTRLRQLARDDAQRREEL